MLILRILLLSYVIHYISATHVHLGWNASRPAFDPQIYEDALDPDLCKEQIRYIRRNISLRLKFLAAGMRLPRGFLDQFNTHDWGLYDSCIEINENIETSVIEGKYCHIKVPITSTFDDVVEAMNWDGFDMSSLDEDFIKEYHQIEEMESKLEAVIFGTEISKNQRTRISSRDDDAAVLAFTMALCVPKVCTSREGLAGLFFNLTLLNFQYEEAFCRFKDDKPWVPGDYVAITLFSLIGFLTIVSTAYDVFHTLILKKDPKTASTLYRSFSVYTNAKRLTTFTHNPNNLNCMDGIRAISMFWIVAGHTYLLVPQPLNFWYANVEFILSLKSLWITAAPFTVDTFLLLAGILLVYTTVGKLSGRNLLKNLHLFYLNRLFRMFPLLATLVLLQATIMHKIADGPEWSYNAYNTDNCRKYWWLTLLYVQNYVNVAEQCLGHSWYLAIDIQCYLVSPIILYWVLNKQSKKQAWAALTVGFLASIIICTVYSFVRKFPGWTITLSSREDGEQEYQFYYYFNTLTRAPPFFFGMVFGYVLYVWKGRQPVIPRYLNVFLWIISGGSMLTLMYITHLMKSVTWDMWTVDDLMNSWGRSVWSAAVAWIIFACQHGYGGPINWFLCLDIWKLPSRISYAIYLFHYHIQFVMRGTARQPIFFRDSYALYNFCAQVLIAYGISFGMTLLIDSPFSILIKLLFGEGPKKKIMQKENTNKNISSETANETAKNEKDESLKL